MSAFPARVPSSKRPHLRYAPLRTVGATEHTQTYPRMAQQIDSPQCPTCSKTFAPASLVREDAAFSPDHQQFVRLVSLYCDHCHEVHDRLVGTNSTGTRDGEAILRGMRKGAEVDRFLEEHPEARGVAQSEGHY